MVLGRAQGVAGCNVCRLDDCRWYTTLISGTCVAMANWLLEAPFAVYNVLAELESGIGDLEGISCAICRHRGWGSVGEVLATQRFPAPMAEE